MRTARVISTLVALMGMVFLLLQRVLSAVLQMATDGLNLGLARYNTFTGRMALQNFPEDRQLFKLLKDVQSILPTADSVLTVLMVVAIVLLAVALVMLAFPRPCVHVLVAFKILKWETGAADEADDASLRDILGKIGEIPLKKLAIPVGVVAAIVVVCLVVSNCHDKIKAASVDGAIVIKLKPLRSMEPSRKCNSRRQPISMPSVRILHRRRWSVEPRLCSCPIRF